MQYQITVLRFFERHKSIVILLIISFGVLLLSGLLGYRANRIPLVLLFAGVGGLVFGVIATKRMMFTLTLLVAFSAPLNITISTGTQTPLPFSLLVLAFLVVVWLSRMMIIDRNVRLEPSPVNKPFLGFILIALVAWVVGFAAWDGRIPVQDNIILVQLGQLAIFGLSIAAVLIVINHPIEEKELKWWTIIIITIGTINLVYWTASKDYLPFPGVTGSMLMWPMMLIWGQMLFNPRLKNWIRVSGLLISLLWIYWMYNWVFAWKGGWLPALMGFTLMVWFKSRRVFLIIGILVLLLLIANWGWINANILNTEIQTQSTIRPYFWYDIIRLTSRSPILGLGPANYMFYWQTPNFIPLSRIISGWEIWDLGYSPPSHNNFIDIFAQTGILGLIFLVWGIIAALILGYRSSSHLQPGFKKAYAYAVLCGFASMVISSIIFADWLIPYVYNVTITGFAHSVYSWLLLGSLLALGNLVKGDRDG